jgi:hypothetical protein
MRTERIEGSRYTGFRSVTDISKDIRRDIKDAIAAGKLPKDLKVSVRSKYYAGGQSIDLDWSAQYGTHQIVCMYHRDRSWRECADTRCRTDHAIVGLSQHGRSIQETLRSIAHAYNYDNSDITVDYFDTMFYCTPSWNWQVRLAASNLVGLDRKVAETFITLHVNDRVPPKDALEMAEKLEALS